MGFSPNRIKSLFTKTTRLLLPLLLKDKKRIAFLLLTLLLIAIDGLIAPLIPIIFGKIASLAPHLPSLLLISFICLWGSEEIIKYLRELSFFYVINQAIMDLRRKLILHMHQIPLAKAENYVLMEIVSADRRVSKSVQKFVKIFFVLLLPSLLKLLSCTFMLISLYKNSAYFVGGMLLTYVWVFFSTKRFLASRKESWVATDYCLAAIKESLQNTREVRFYLDEEVKRLAEHFRAESQRWLRTNSYLQAIYIVQNLFLFTIAGLMLTHYMTTSTYKLQELIALKGCSFYLIRAMNTITQEARSMITGINDLEKVIELLSIPTLQYPESKKEKTPEQEKPLLLEAREISFSHQASSQKLIESLSLKVSYGEKIIIKGYSAEGKSTLLHLLSGLYQPVEGTIFYKGKDLKSIPATVLGKKVIFLSQNASIISVHPDRKPFYPLYSEKQLFGHLSLESSVGVSGLSGGEKQYTLLMQSLARKPELLILDELFCALNQDHTKILLKKIFSIVPTVILVTHCTEIFPYFTTIYQMRNGTLQNISPSSSSSQPHKHACLDHSNDSTTDFTYQEKRAQ